MKNFFCIFFIAIPSLLFSQQLSPGDVRELAVEINEQLNGQDLGNGIVVRNCKASGMTLVYSYDVQNEGSIPGNLTEDLLAGLKAEGNSQFFYLNNIDLRFRYYKENALFKTIEIDSDDLFMPQNELGEFLDLGNHPKSKGVNFKLKSPKNWKIQEGDRPNVIKKFVDGSNVFLVIIRENMTFFSRNQAREIFSDSDFKNEFIEESVRHYKNYEILNQRIITTDSYPALEFTFSGITENSGYDLEMTTKAWVILYEDKVVHFQGSSLGQKNFKQREHLYTSVINSVIFPDQYTY